MKIVIKKLKKKFPTRDQHRWQIHSTMSLIQLRIEKKKDVAFKTKSVIRYKLINSSSRYILVCLGQSFKQSMIVLSFQQSMTKYKLRNIKTQMRIKERHQLIQIRMKVPVIEHKTLIFLNLILKISLNRNMTIWNSVIRMFWLI